MTRASTCGLTQCAGKPQCTRCETQTWRSEGPTDDDRIQQALVKVVAAWESLPEGHYTADKVEKWLGGRMFRAIENARKVLR